MKEECVFIRYASLFEFTIPRIQQFIKVAIRSSAFNTTTTLLMDESDRDKYMRSWFAEQPTLSEEMVAADTRRSEELAVIEKRRREEMAVSDRDSPPPGT
jgi:hypothetical protein